MRISHQILTSRYEIYPNNIQSDIDQKKKNTGIANSDMLSDRQKPIPIRYLKPRILEY